MAVICEVYRPLQQKDILKTSDSLPFCCWSYWYCCCSVSVCQHYLFPYMWLSFLIFSLLILYHVLFKLTIFFSALLCLQNKFVHVQFLAEILATHIRLVIFSLYHFLWNGTTITSGHFVIKASINIDFNNADPHFRDFDIHSICL